MKKYLPKFKNSNGFTLIELLVVVAIIAILTIIAISIYSGVQAKSRDARRQAEIDSLAKSLNVRKDATTATFTYDGTMYDADYPSTKPQDPSGTAVRNYCIDAPAPAADPSPWTTTCPSGYDIVPNADGACIMGAAGCTIPSAPTSWKICASLEGSSAVFCKSNL